MKLDWRACIYRLSKGQSTYGKLIGSSQCTCLLVRPCTRAGVVPVGVAPVGVVQWVLLVGSSDFRVQVYPVQ